MLRKFVYIDFLSFLAKTPQGNPVVSGINKKFLRVDQKGEGRKVGKRGKMGKRV